MDHVVEEMAARTLIVEAPDVPVGGETRLERRVGLADHRLDAHMGGLADGTLGDEALGEHQRGVVAEALADPQDGAGRLGRGGHRTPLVDRVGERLLARDVLAGLCRGDHVVVVEIGRSEDLEGVDRGIGERSSSSEV